MVARGFIQAYNIDYTETFSLVIHLQFVCMLLSLTVNQAWSLHQLDIFNVFLYTDLEEYVFIEKPFGIFAQGESFKMCFLL